MNRKKKHTPGHRLAVVVMLFYFLAFLLLAQHQHSVMGYLLAVIVPGIIFCGAFLLPYLFPTDRLLMLLTNFLCAMGVLLLYSADPALALQQAVSYGIGLVAMIVCIYMVRAWRSLSRFSWILIPFSLMLLALPLIFGNDINGARNWVVFGSFSFQPSEIVKLFLIITLAWFFSRMKILPALFFLLVCVSFLMLQKDLGAVLLYFVTALLLCWAATGNLWISLSGIGMGTIAAWYGYHSFAHVRLRVALWKDPWLNNGTSGYQLIRGLEAISNGGLWGVGLGRGDPASIPVYESDFIFAVLCEQFGLIFAGCVLLMYVALILRGASIAISSRRSFHGLLAMGATIILGLQTFVIVGGVLNMIPLTGITLPFISHGGTSLISSMCLVGFVQGVESLNEENLDEDIRLSALER